MICLQRAEVEALRSKDSDGQANVAPIRAELVRMELALGPAVTPLPGSLLERSRLALDSDSVLLSLKARAISISLRQALDREDEAPRPSAPR